MAAAVQILAAVVVALLMFVVGLAVSAASLRRVAASPRRLGTLLLGQVLLVPLVGVGLVVSSNRLLGGDAESGASVGTWVLILAACPGGAISNALVLYGRGDVTLSVVLTAGSSLLAAITMPLVLLACRDVGLLPTLSVPGGVLFATTLLLLLLPCVAGIAVAARRPAIVPVLARIAGRLGGLALVAALVLGVWVHRDAVAETWWVAVAAAVAFVLVGGGVGRLFAGLLGFDGPARFAVAAEFGLRNLAVALAVATLSPQGDGFAGFGAVYLLVEVALVAAWAHRRRGRPEEGMDSRRDRRVGDRGDEGGSYTRPR
jgi:BASS family bile acid:Na+ symporter